MVHATELCLGAYTVYLEQGTVIRTAIINILMVLS